MEQNEILEQLDTSIELIEQHRYETANMDTCEALLAKSHLTDRTVALEMQNRLLKSEGIIIRLESIINAARTAELARQAGKK